MLALTGMYDEVGEPTRRAPLISSLNGVILGNYGIRGKPGN